ncbi:hypothetical protein KY346_06725 [Candidatus Woesearchaeota archaeon]|nr:hypothetical protein [Candidatus Woesearchaeota archaeon]
MVEQDEKYKSQLGGLNDIEYLRGIYEKDPADLVKLLQARLDIGLGPEDTAFVEVMDMLQKHYHPDAKKLKLSGLETTLDWKTDFDKEPEKGEEESKTE